MGNIKDKLKETEDMLKRIPTYNDFYAYLAGRWSAFNEMLKEEEKNEK